MRSALPCALVCLALAALASPSAAGAHSPAPWFGSYQVSVLGGDQHAEWSADHASTGRCDPSINGQGSDTQSFLPGAPQVVQMAGVGSTAYPTTISGLQLNYTEDREGSLTETQVPPECAVASGEGTANPPSPDCGTRSLSTSIDVTPLPGSTSLEQSPGADTGEGSPYQDCPVFGSVVPAFASPLSASLPPLGPVLAGGTPSGTALVQATEPIAEEDVSGQSTLKLELRFTSLLVVDALGMPADAALTVGSSGEMTVPVSCPAGTCSGSVSLAFDTAATGARVASAPRFPQPVSAYTIALTSARFHLKAGHRGVVLHLQGGRTFAKALAHDTFAVIVSDGSGHKSVRYVAGLAHLRA